jgi:hypothetical protein
MKKITVLTLIFMGLLGTKIVCSAGEVGFVSKNPVKNEQPSSFEIDSPDTVKLSAPKKGTTGWVDKSTCDVACRRNTGGNNATPAAAKKPKLKPNAGNGPRNPQGPKPHGPRPKPHGKKR